MNMILFSVLYGLFLVGIGFVIKRYPILIAGYKTISKLKEHRSVDVESIACIYKRGFIIIGIVTMLSSGIATWMEYLQLAFAMRIIPLILGMIILYFVSQKYYHLPQQEINSESTL